MKKESRVAKSMILTEKDFISASKNEKIASLIKMLSNNIYGFRVKVALYYDKKISEKGLLFNDNIYNLPLGTKNGKGEILIDNSILAVFDRYLLAEDMASKGDALTAFVVDHDDMLYNAILANKTADIKMSEEKYIELFSMAYSSLSNIILDHKVNVLLTNTPELAELAS